MKKLIILAIISLTVIGCGIVEKEVVTEETTISTIVREPYPIMREYNNVDGYIDFTTATATIEINRIYYDNYNPSTGVGAEDQITVSVPANCTGNVVTLQVRGKLYSWTCYDDNPHNLVLNMKAGTEFPDFRYLGLTVDVLDANNQYDFVRLFINNVLYEMYYLSDF